MTTLILGGCATPPGPAQQDSRLSKLAEQLEQRGDTASAVVLYERAIAAMPDNPDLLIALGRAQLRNGNPAAATQAFQQAYRLRPDDAQAELGLGYAALLDHDLERANSLVSKAAARIGTYQAYNLQGITATLNGDFVQARQALMAAQGLAPTNLEIRANLALVQALDNDLKGAVAQIGAVTASPLAQPHHLRRQALILVLAKQDKQAERVLRSLPSGERKTLLTRAKHVRTLRDPAERAREIGILPTFGPGPGSPV